MDKEKSSKKRSSIDEKRPLPTPPPSPQLQARASPSTTQNPLYPEAFKRLLDYKKREIDFLKTLDETINEDCKKLRGEQTERESQQTGKDHSETTEINENSQITNAALVRSESRQLREECDHYLIPLLNRSGPSIAAALVTYDAFDQLTKLHGLLNQLINVRNQNFQMQKQIRNVRTLCDLKKLQKKDSSEMPEEIEYSDNDLDLSAILAAGNSASSKRSTAKRQRERSKSVIADDIQMFTLEKEKTSSLRRQSQSAYSDSKAKVSKWTKVKAAFKWERANVATMNEGKSLDSGISLGPVNNEVARYLRVPSVPCAGSSADSVLSSSSGHLLSGGSVPATPGTISSASSMEDVGGVSEENRNNRDSSKSDSRCDSRTNEEESRRSRSLDGDAVINSHSLTRDGKNKTPWKKVKDIIQTHRGSFKGKSRTRSIKSSGTCSRDHSPCESIDALSNAEDRSIEHAAPSPTSPFPRNMPSLNVSYEGGPFAHSSHDPISSIHIRDESDGKILKGLSKINRRSRVLTDFEVLPEDVIVDVKSTGKSNRGRLPPSPLNLRQDSSDAEFSEMCHSPTFFGKTPPKIFRSRKPLTSGNSSVPSSPSRHSEFFGECDTTFPVDEFSSGDFSEPSSPHRNQKLSPNSSFLVQQKEINEKYFELCEQLAQEFEAKQEEWKKIQAACAMTASTAYHIMGKDECPFASKNLPANLLEENLSPDFKKKLHKWRVKKQNSVTTKDPQTSPTKENEQKRIDWNLWKTGQLKLEGQGLTPIPDQKDLSEEFQKKLEQWRKLKESNTVPPYNSQDSLKRSKKYKEDSDKQRSDREKPKTHERDKLEKLSKLKAIVTDSPAKEIEVKTSKGVLKFEGISRKFTRKLYEWEKARGIGPESSTFALLHPGYRPLDVGNGSQDNAIQDNSPVLGRSLSLDSISPNPSVPSISHQPSSLSLNDMKESTSTPEGLDESERTQYNENVCRQQDEPEAVIVEVEDDIIETAAPLMTAQPMVEHQTPVYKYQIPCPEFCTRTPSVHLENTSTFRRQISERALQNVSNLRRLQSHQDENFKEHVKHVQNVLKSLEESLPDLESSLHTGSSRDLDLLRTIKKLVNELIQMLNSLMLTQSFDTEEFQENSRVIDVKLSNLQRNIDLICKKIESKKIHEQIPEIKIISDESNAIGRAIFCTTPTLFHSEVIVNQPKVMKDIASVQEAIIIDQIRLDAGEASSKKINRTVSNGSKKKMRLRKIGSRQNSKTESDSDEESLNVTLEAPRRIKRRTSKAKRNPDEERKYSLEEKNEDSMGGEDIVYVLKVKPGQKIEQEVKQDCSSDRNILISPKELRVELMEVKPEQVSSTASIFVKTKRKVFTAIDEPSGAEPKVAIAKDIETSSTSDRTSRESSVCDNEKCKTQISTSLPPIPQSPNTQRRMDVKSSPLKEPSPSIRMMIQKYNQKVEKSSRNRTGSMSPVAYRSPVLERRIKAQNDKVQKDTEKVVKSISAGNIQVSGLIVADIPEIECQLHTVPISKASSAEVLPSDRKGSVNETDEECQISASLACDSLRAIKVPNTVAPPAPPIEKEKKEHLYKKNKEKPTSLFTKTGAVKKLGLKTGKASENIWRRSISSTPSESWSLPEKADNTLPRITRKSDALDIWSKSAPSTPMSEDYDPLKTPLSERALKIQRAKEEFLKRDVQRSSTWETSGSKNSNWQKRLSSSSFGSTASNDLNEGGLLIKSASVGLIGSVPNENLFAEDYMLSLPRPPEKSSKFGFSSIASKFRKVKMRRGTKEQSSKHGAVSALCRQSLAVVEMHADAAVIQNEMKQTESGEPTVQKSSSSHGFWSGFKKFDKVSKSKSANVLPQYDKDTKE